MAPPRAALFDFDGTLADSFAEMSKVYDQVAQQLGLRQLTTAEFESFRDLKPLEVLRAAGIPLRKMPSLLRAMRAGMRERTKNLHPFPGIREALTTLRAHGCLCGILSSNSLENVQCFLERNHLPAFDFFSCGTSFLGKASRLKKLVRQLELPRTNIFYIGDEVRDIEAAHEAGVRSIGVTWGLASRAALAAAHPTHLAESPAEWITQIISAPESLA